MDCAGKRRWRLLTDFHATNKSNLLSDEEKETEEKPESMKEQMEQVVPSQVYAVADERAGSRPAATGG